MIDLTRSRVAASGHRASRVSYEICRFEDLNLEPEAFDIVVSAISLHHVVDKATLFQRIHTWLKPSGALRLSDQIAGSSPSNHKRNWDAWLEWCRRPSNCTEAEITSLIEHSEAHDHYVSLGEHFRLLELAGFKNPDCVWRDGMWGVITADV
jgi:ubiquinone/menaquinone biosynthesis C-methylase UbiE